MPEGVTGSVFEAHTGVDSDKKVKTHKMSEGTLQNLIKTAFEDEFKGIIQDELEFYEMELPIN